MDKKIKKLLKNKRFIIVCVLLLIGIICLILLKNVLYPNSRVSYYGNRLDGIENVEFSEKNRNNIIKELKKNEVVTESKINVHGKIINIIFNVKKDTSVDDARKIASESLNNFSDDVKNFYDIQVIITKSDEEEIEITNSEGVKEKIKEFPIMGYKNSNTKEIIW